jgi:hypothetical protein
MAKKRKLRRGLSGKELKNNYPALIQASNNGRFYYLI